MCAVNDSWGIEMGMASGRTNHKRGFTLVEASIVLGVVGLVIGGIWMASSELRLSQKVNTAQDEILSVVQHARSLYSSGHIADPGEEVQGVFINMGVFPKQMVSGSNVVSPWDTTVSVSVADDQLDLAFADIPKAACVKLAMGLAAKDAEMGLSRTTINDSEFIDKVSLEDADAACTEKTFITWTYGLNGEKLGPSEMEAPISMAPEEM